MLKKKKREKKEKGAACDAAHQNQGVDPAPALFPTCSVKQIFGDVHAHSMRAVITLYLGHGEGKKYLKTVANSASVPPYHLLRLAVIEQGTWTGKSLV